MHLYAIVVAQALLASMVLAVDVFGIDQPDAKAAIADIKVRISWCKIYCKIVNHLADGPAARFQFPL